MIKKRRSSAKAAFGQQEAALRRGAPGKKFVGDDTGSAEGRAAELEKVHRMQVAARANSQPAEHESERPDDELLGRPWLHAVGGLVVESARLASTVAWLPLRLAKLPFRVAASFIPRFRAT